MVVALGRIAARYGTRQTKNTISNNSDKFTLFTNHLHTIIVAISHHDMVGAALNGDLARIIELVVVASFSTKGRNKTAFAVKHLQSMIAAVTHHDCVVAVIIINTTRIIQLAIAIAIAAKHSSRLTWEECLAVDVVAADIAHVVGIQNREKIEGEKHKKQLGNYLLLCLVCAKQFWGERGRGKQRWSEFVVVVGE